jgi:Viral BACON domain
LPLSSSAQSSNNKNKATRSVKKHNRPAALKVPRFYTVATGENGDTQETDSHGTATSVKLEQNATISDKEAFAPAQQIDDKFEISDDYDIHRRATWSKIVTYKTPRVEPAPVIPVTTIPSPLPVTPEPAIPPPPPPAQPGKVPPQEPHRVPTRLFSWISVVVLVGLFLGGIFGIVLTLGRGILGQPSHTPGMLTLQVVPSTVAPGGIITLHGSNFRPSGRVGLTRDTNIKIVDTGGANIIHADKAGSFSDTVIVDPAWGAGPHIISAEDASLHKSATFPIMVTGQSTSLRPAHLLFSMKAIDFGSGDQASNSTRVITLSNAGGGLISWQARTTQAWLLISPKSGTFASGQNMQVVIAVERANLKVGAYAASVIFTSNAGQYTIPVKMSVTKLQPGNEAVLQLTPPVLSFSGFDGGASPPGQVVTVSNPGVRPLQWGASTSTSDGFNWLSVSPQSGTVNIGNSQPVTVSVNSNALLPGVYSGWVTFANRASEPVKDSPQTVYVSVTIVPQCSIQVSPGSLTFTGVYSQPGPAPKIINVGVIQGCSTPLQWSASVITNQGGSWLKIGSTAGRTPAYPSVAVSATGLTPGTYTGYVIFSSSAGTQTLPVTYILGQTTTSIMATTPALLAFKGIIGQPNPPPQAVSVANSGGGTLTWHATAATAVGGAWLSVAPATGIRISHQSATITVTATPLATLIPGTYNGTITITATDSLGKPAIGSPQSIPVTFVVQAPCTIAATPLALTFQGVAGQPNPATQPVTIGASGACANALSWTAAAGGTWLTTTPATGTVSTTASSVTNVGVVLAGVPAGTYTGTVTITAIDSVTQKAVGTPQTIKVTLTVQPACTLQAPSITGETFAAEAGSNPAAQTFTIGVIGGCLGAVTITPTATTGWLAVSPATAPVASGSSATFTVTVTSAALAAGSYTGSISLAAVDGGIAITGSPQTVAVTLNVVAPPALTAGPALTFNVVTGTSPQAITIANTGGEPLNWTATLGAGAPGFVSLSASGGTNLAGGASTTVNVLVDATGVQGGSTFTTSVIISAIDPITGQAVAGSPSTVPITINIAPPQMALSATSLTFTTTAGTNPAAQPLTIQNTGGGTLTWTAGAPSAAWLTGTPTTGSDTSQASSTATFSVDVTGLSPGTYTATVVITPSAGSAVTVTVTLTVN